MARRKISLNKLLQRVNITNSNFSILKSNSLRLFDFLF
ncbi:MAG: hypothetical protein ACTHWZ_05495 [Peptoniphilaceae bacterium]